MCSVVASCTGSDPSPKSHQMSTISVAPGLTRAPNATASGGSPIVRVAVARAMVGPASMWMTRSTNSTAFSGSFVLISRYRFASSPGLPSFSASIATSSSAISPTATLPLAGSTITPSARTPVRSGTAAAGALPLLTSTSNASSALPSTLLMATLFVTLPRGGKVTWIVSGSTAA